MAEENRNGLGPEIFALREGFMLRSNCTRMPYVECGETMNDRAFLFTSRTEAETAARQYNEKGIPVTAAPLIVHGVPNNKVRMISEVRRFLVELLTLNIDVVYYKKEGELPQEVYVTDIVPAPIARQITDSDKMNPLLALTGLFFMQQARLPREKQDAGELKTAEEEFSANLVKSRLLLPLLPPEEVVKAKDPEAKVNLKDCRFPVIKTKTGEVFSPVFTDLSELEKYANGKPMLSLQVPFTALHNYLVKGPDGTAKGFLINPGGIAMPLMAAQLKPLCERFGLAQQNFSAAPAETAAPAEELHPESE